MPYTLRHLNRTPHRRWKTHGLSQRDPSWRCALDTLILPTERAGDFEALAQSLLGAYRVRPGHESNIPDKRIQSEWFHLRAAKAYAEVEADIYKTTPNPVDWTEEQHKKLGRFLRYKTKHANQAKAFLKQLESFRKHLRTEEDAVLKQSKVDVKAGQDAAKREKEERLEMLEALSEHGLVRFEDLTGVFDDD